MADKWKGGPVARGPPIVGGWASRKLRKSDSNSPIADHSARITRLLHTVKISFATCAVCPLPGQWNPAARRVATANSGILQDTADSTRPLIHHPSCFRLLWAIPLEKIFELKTNPRSQFEMTARQGVRAHREVSKTDQ